MRAFAAIFFARLFWRSSPHAFFCACRLRRCAIAAVDRRHQLLPRTGGRTRCPSCASPRTRPSPPGRRVTEASVASRASALREAVVARRDREARRHPLHVVLERARQRLVEVVQVEQQRPLGRREHTEVRQMRVAAELNRQAGPRRVLQVGGHDLGRAPVEGERRDHHPPVTHRHQVRLAGRVLLLEQRDRVGAVRGRLPTRVARRRYLLPCFLSPSFDVRLTLGCSIVLGAAVACGLPPD